MRNTRGLISWAGESSLDSTSKVAFLSSDFYFQVEYTLAGSKVGTYNYEKGSLTLSQTNGAVTMKGINEDGSELTFSFGPTASLSAKTNS